MKKNIDIEGELHRINCLIDRLYTYCSFQEEYIDVYFCSVVTILNRTNMLFTSEGMTYEQLKKKWVELTKLSKEYTRKKEQIKQILLHERKGIVDYMPNGFKGIHELGLEIEERKDYYSHKKSSKTKGTKKRKK